MRLTSRGAVFIRLADASRAAARILRATHAVLTLCIHPAATAKGNSLTRRTRPVETGIYETMGVSCLPTSCRRITSIALELTIRPALRRRPGELSVDGGASRPVSSTTSIFTRHLAGGHAWTLIVDTTALAQASWHQARALVSRARYWPQYGSRVSDRRRWCDPSVPGQPVHLHPDWQALASAQYPPSPPQIPLVHRAPARQPASLTHLTPTALGGWTWQEPAEHITVRIRDSVWRRYIDDELYCHENFMTASQRSDTGHSRPITQSESC